jgi:hypothetical protein
MSKDLFLFVLVTISVGSIATLVSGLYMQDLTRGVGASVIGYGFPTSWREKVVIVYPGNPTRCTFSIGSFVLDIAFWSLIVDLPIAFLLRRCKTRRP